MGVRDRLRGFGDAVTSAATTAGKDLVNRASQAGRGGATASGDWVHGVLGALPAPAAPAVEQWEFSLGALVCRHPRVPAITAKALRSLDGIGALRFGPESVGFDGEDIPWDKVVRIQLHNAFAAMTTDALDNEVDRVRELLPPIPGRKWAVTKVVEGLAAVVLASVEQAADERLDAVNVACEITYRGGMLGREKTLRANLFTTALLAHQADVAYSLVVTAQAKGVPVLPADPGALSVEMAERVRALRARTDTVAAELQAEREDDGQPGPSALPGQQGHPGQPA
ncbi:hypothetical protein LRS74_18985 [Streptomyces sp. LX-29]|uniref:hypothetical protein n=1 Tax=Streptomyces sp. LX-29 TaxID=2900152 RepID=UPI00240D9F51|nr:hypothetical protein [Streptomyces sp. LX-29]WFB08893.1 hypothetical protein LRS74_18985 [Streptomyces sp. LX-29]